MAIDPRRIEVIDDRTAEIYMRMTPAQRVEAANVMFAPCFRMVECGLRSMYSDRSEAWLRAEVIKRVPHGTM